MRDGPYVIEIRSAAQISSARPTSSSCTSRPTSAASVFASPSTTPAPYRARLRECIDRELPLAAQADVMGPAR